MTSMLNRYSFVVYAFVVGRHWSFQFTIVLFVAVLLGSTGVIS